MSEQEKAQEKKADEQKEEDKTENKTEDAGDTKDGDASDEKKDFAIVREAKQAAEVIKGENDRKEKLIEREEKLQDRKEALKALGGGSPAGDRPVESKEETPKEYKDRVMGNDPTLTDGRA